MVRYVAASFLVLAILFSLPAMAEDKEGCKDHPMFNRMPNFEICNCKDAEFDVFDFAKKAAKEYEPIEGKIFNVGYCLKEGTPPVSSLQIIRNFQNAAKSAGGEILGEYVNPFSPSISPNMEKYMVESAGGLSYDRYTNIKLVKGNSEYWVNVAASEEYRDYNVVIVERQAMEQAVSINELVDKLNKEGFITLYVNFDTNKSTIKPESTKTLDDAAEVLKTASTLSVDVNGHTDNVGTPEANMKLSQDRANAVKAALVQRGVAADRMTAKGFGQTQPIADNRTEEGRAKNRRVELAKK